MAYKKATIGIGFIVLLISAGGAAASLGVFSDVQRVSFGETTFEQSDLTVQSATPVGPGNNVDQIDVAIRNPGSGELDATVEVWLLSNATEVATGTLTHTFTAGKTTVSVPLDDRTRMAAYDSVDIRLTET